MGSTFIFIIKYSANIFIILFFYVEVRDPKFVSDQKKSKVVRIFLPRW